jgi:hypothetical protein
MNAQLGPGYMGKRCVAGYGLNFSPAFFGPNGMEESILQIGNSAGGELAFNSMHEGFFEFAFKNRTSVGFSAKYFRTSYANQEQVQYNDYTGGYGYGNYGHPSGFYHIKGIDYNLYFKFYHRRYVAPWGRYIILGAVLNRYKCVYDPSTMFFTFYDSNNYENKTMSNFGPTEQVYMRGDIRFGWGRSRILFNRITLDYGINFELLAFAGNFVEKGELDEIFYYNLILNSNYIEKTSKSRVREVSSVNLFIKLGVLLF